MNVRLVFTGEVQITDVISVQVSVLAAAAEEIAL
jgi:hypothetical protein